MKRDSSSRRKPAWSRRSKVTWRQAVLRTNAECIQAIVLKDRILSTKSISRVPVKWWGYVLSRHRPEMEDIRKHMLNVSQLPLLTSLPNPLCVQEYTWIGPFHCYSGNQPLESWKEIRRKKFEFGNLIPLASTFRVICVVSVQQYHRFCGWSLVSSKPCWVTVIVQCVVSSCLLLYIFVILLHCIYVSVNCFVIANHL